MEEFEIKYLDIDVPALEKKLLEIGAEKVGEYDYARMLLDYPEHNLEKKNSWVRLRTDGKETTLAYKANIKEKLPDGTLKNIGMKEIEINVDDYDRTYHLLKAIGLVIKREEKNRRVRYKKGNVVFDIDFGPFIPTYLEIESDSFEEARAGAEELGFKGADGIICSAGAVYKKHGFDTSEYSSITFEGMVKK